MMRAILNFISSTAFSDLAFSGGGRTRTLTIQRRASVRGLRLTVDPRDATVRLTLDTRAPLRPALAWAAGKRAWVEVELARLPAATPIVPGLVFGLGDAEVVVHWSFDFRRTPNFVSPVKAGTHLPTIGQEIGSRFRGNDEVMLQLGGPRDQLAARTLRFLRAQALSILEAETRELAAAHGIAIGRVSVGDPKTRWGSCAASGDIRYSWRLILAPAFVRRATVAHEVAHRLHMNHGRDFHAFAAKLTGEDPARSRRWLRANGASLHWFGRDD